MPFLRFTRDRRGYENTFLVHTTRRRGKEQAQVLYWFRSPPHVKVGRAALDEDAIRAIEQAHSDIAFDWARILEARPPGPEPEDEGPGRRPRGREHGGRTPASDRLPAAPTPRGADREERASAPPVDRRERAEVIARTDALDGEAEPGPGRDPLDLETLAVEPDEVDQVPGHGPPSLEPSAAERALGPEGLQRLRARHAEVLARIGDQVSDPERADALRVQAEGLSPDAWVTDAEVRAGLERFELTLEAIRRELGPPRRRGRRGGRRRSPGSEHTGEVLPQSSGQGVDIGDRDEPPGEHGTGDGS